MTTDKRNYCSTDLYSKFNSIGRMATNFKQCQIKNLVVLSSNDQILTVRLLKKMVNWKVCTCERLINGHMVQIKTKV